MRSKERGYLLFLLSAIFAVAHMDRHILSISLDAIGQEFTLSNTQLGLLSGLVFAVMFVLAGFPIARLAAYKSRRDIVATSAAVWSILTMLMAGAQSFAHLILARLGVGLGEAGAVAPAHAILSDHFPPERRASALATFATGANIGVLLAFLVGGIVGQALGWRWAFVLAGLPGLVLAILLRCTTTETRVIPQGRSHGQSPAIFRKTLSMIWQDTGLLHALMGIALTGVVTFGVLAWVPTFIMRTHELSQAQTGVYLALTTGIIGGLGTWYSGRLADQWGRSDPRWRFGIVILGVLAAKPLVWVFFLSDTTAVALVCFAVAATVSAVFWGPTFAFLHDRLPNELRPMGTAIFLFGFNLTGVGIGPTIVGLTSDTIFAGFGDNALRVALAAVHLVGFWGLWHYWQAMRHVSDSVEV